MLKALNQRTEEAIVILSPRWASRLSDLRQLDRQDALVCPGCRQPVRVKAGKVKRWHFAHKHLANCPFEGESPLLLEMRSVLYTYLVGQLGEAAVTVEYQLDGLPRHVDCWASGRAFWIFDTRMPPDERQCLRDVLARQDGLFVTWVFAAALLRIEPEQPSQIHLTTTEREFMRRTDCDEAAPLESFLFGSTLHYLDSENCSLITYRNLNLFHRPQVYGGRRLESPLDQVQLDKLTGDFLHPGEAERLQHYRQTRQHRQEKMRSTLPGLIPRAKSLLSETDKPKLKDSEPLQANSSKVHQISLFDLPSHTPFARQAACRYCGIVTEDWVSFDGKTGTCVCRDCARQASEKSG